MINRNVVTKEGASMSMIRRGRPSIIAGRNKIYVRVLFSEEDYLELQKIADEERTDISTLVRRAVARFYFTSNKNNSPRHTSQE
jgi:hypothetical protein